MTRRSEKPRKVNFKNLLYSKFFLIFCLVLVMLLSVSVVKEVLRKIEINREINFLEQEIAQMENKNQELAELIDYFNTSRFQEKEVKSRLNLKEQGETVVFIPENNRTGNFSITTEDSGNEGVKTAQITNPQKWWGYFFSN